MEVLERDGIAETLEQARARTLALLEGLSEEQLSRQVSPLQSPLVWDFAHIGHFEELWLVRNVGGNPPLHAEHDDVYDAFAHARAERGELPFLEPAAARAFVDDVRGRALEVLDRLEPSRDPLLENGFVFGLVVQHELQHIETMAQTMQLGGLPLDASPLPEVQGSGEALVAGGAFALGAAADEPWAYDNELPSHDVDGPFVRNRPCARDERGVPRLHRRRRLSGSLALERRGLGAGWRRRTPRLPSTGSRAAAGNCCGGAST